MTRIVETPRCAKGFWPTVAKPHVTGHQIQPTFPRGPRVGGSDGSRQRRGLAGPVGHYPGAETATGFRHLRGPGLLLGRRSSCVRSRPAIRRDRHLPSSRLENSLRATRSLRLSATGSDDHHCKTESKPKVALTKDRAKGSETPGTRPLDGKETSLRAVLSQKFDFSMELEDRHDCHGFSRFEVSGVSCCQNSSTSEPEVFVSTGGGATSGISETFINVCCRALPVTGQN